MGRVGHTGQEVAWNDQGRGCCDGLETIDSSIQR